MADATMSDDFDDQSDTIQAGSEDSGKGGSDIQVEPSYTYTNDQQLNDEPYIVFQFELPQALCGRLIGKSGHFVRSIKEKSNASVIVNIHPFSPFFKICSIEGK